MNDYEAMVLIKSRERDYMEAAEKARKVKSLREKATRRIRRVIRINNDPIR